MRTNLLLSVLLLTALVPCVEADTDVSPCGVGTVQSYENNANGCELGGANGGILVFSQFTFSTSMSGSPVILDASQISVTPDAQGLGGGFTSAGLPRHPLVWGRRPRTRLTTRISSMPVRSAPAPTSGWILPLETCRSPKRFAPIRLLFRPIRARNATIPDDPFAPQTFSMTTRFPRSAGQTTWISTRS